MVGRFFRQIKEKSGIKKRNEQKNNILGYSKRSTSMGTKGVYCKIKRRGEKIIKKVTTKLPNQMQYC